MRSVPFPSHPTGRTYRPERAGACLESHSRVEARRLGGGLEVAWRWLRGGFNNLIESPFVRLFALWGVTSTCELQLDSPPPMEDRKQSLAGGRGRGVGGLSRICPSLQHLLGRMWSWELPCRVTSCPGFLGVHDPQCPDQVSSLLTLLGPVPCRGSPCLQECGFSLSPPTAQQSPGWDAPFGTLSPRYACLLRFPASSRHPEEGPKAQ